MLNKISDSSLNFHIRMYQFIVRLWYFIERHLNVG